MKILDTQTGDIHEYGTDGHDSLYVSRDGRTLSYYNLQNGDGSAYGDYRFVCDDNKVPAESETADARHANVYFNIGGWRKRPQSELAKEVWGLYEKHRPYLATYVLEFGYELRELLDKYQESSVEKPQGECRTCRHRDPEDKKCDCGGLERQGCPFPVSDNYFCKFYEKGSAE